MVSRSKLPSATMTTLNVVPIVGPDSWYSTLREFSQPNLGSVQNVEHEMEKATVPRMRLGRSQAGYARTKRSGKNEANVPLAPVLQESSTRSLVRES